MSYRRPASRDTGDRNAPVKVAVKNTYTIIEVIKARYRIKRGGEYMSETTDDKTIKVNKSNGGQFQKGQKRPPNAGRKKGTPNKKTAQFKEILGDFDTVVELKNLYATTDKDDLKFAICKEFLKYEYPQRKAVEIANDIELPEFTIKGL